jgi:hypothetical protein
MLIIDMSAVKLPGDAKLNNLPPKCGQPIDAGDHVLTHLVIGGGFLSKKHL